MGRAALAFSIMCMFLTVLYFAFGALAFAYSHSIVRENEMDMRDEQHGANNHNHASYTGFIDNRFDVRSSANQSGYVVPLQQSGGHGTLI